MPAYLTVELTGLRFFARHGWHHQEAKTGNEFEVSVIASFTTEDAIITSIEQTVNYAAVYQLVKNEFLKPEKLLETCAMKIAEQVKVQFPQLEHIKVSIKKLAAPIENFIGTVGITYNKDYK